MTKVSLIDGHMETEKDRLEELTLENMGYCERSDCKHYLETICMAGEVEKNHSGYTLWKYNKDGTKKPNDYTSHSCKAFEEGEHEWYIGVVES